MRKLAIDMDYVQDLLLRLLKIPSPTGYTDEIVHFAGQELERLDIPYELTRRGAIRADLSGDQQSPDRAVVAHLDTLGAMVKQLKPNGRLAVVPIGHWSARFAEGARVTIFTDETSRRGTILPLKASGHTFGAEIDTQPVAWDNLEIRVDETARNEEDLVRMGFHIGDYVAIDPLPEICDSGFINSRHLDDKAGVACLFGAAKAIMESGARLALDCHLLLTISEETGSGASAVLHGDVAEMVAIDNGAQALGQNSKEFGVTVSMMDASGPFDYHLTHKLLRLCRDFDISHQRDIFRYYRTDAASALEAGNDIRTALLCFGIDSSHGYERVHLDALKSLSELLALYMQSGPTSPRDRYNLSSLENFPRQPT
ncbi:osmoprotectant NAGGN system M42 family peptidase [Rhodospirillaceae bacterium SYSU D60014]|uniref:osmoprotectant NAGGN system M42 family peptidase n=1 Tax=Virgifigura deserti TaxID=2268457 RepID=UPI000E66532B